MARMVKALGEVQPETMSPSTSTSQPIGSSQVATERPSSGNASSGPATPASSAEDQEEQPATPTASQPDRAALTAERMRRLEAARKEHAEEVAKRRREEKGKGKADGEDGGGAPGSKHREQVNKANQQFRQRQQEAQKERQRILKQIEDDRAERKARDEAKKAARLAAEAASEEPTETAGEPAADTSARRSHDHCALQVRLLDGSSIRTRFPASATVRQDVRKWVDEHRGSDSGSEPYTFRVLIVPSRVIDETEEGQTLAELGLAPSATLCLLPVVRYSTAYYDPDAGIVSGIGSLFMHMWTIILAFIWQWVLGPFSRLFDRADAGQGQAQQPQPREQGDQRRRAKGPHTLDKTREQQLYNGNSVSLEALPSLNIMENSKNSNG